jgi:hypothetical protein
MDVPAGFPGSGLGGGVHTGRKIVPATDLPPFGKRHFAIPSGDRGKKRVRFAVWDSAGNGAMAQPVKSGSAASNAPR